MALSASAQQKKHNTRLLFTSKCNLQQNIPTPKVCFNFELGEMHTDHTQLTLHESNKASDRIAIETTGYTFENRPYNDHMKSLKLGSY
jgi:hypothetical protein